MGTIDILPEKQGTATGGAGGKPQLCDQVLGKKTGSRDNQGNNQELGVYADPTVDGAPYVWVRTSDGFLRIQSFLATTNKVAGNSGAGTLSGRCCLVSTIGAFDMSNGCWRVRRRVRWNRNNVPAIWLMQTANFSGDLYPTPVEIDITELGLTAFAVNTATLHAVPTYYYDQGTVDANNAYNAPITTAGMFCSDYTSLVEDWYCEITNAWICIGLSIDGGPIQLVSQFANPGPGGPTPLVAPYTGRHHLLLNTTVSGLGNDQTPANYDYSDGAAYMDVMLADAYQTAAERSADGNTQVAQVTKYPRVVDFVMPAVVYNQATDVSLNVLFGDGSARTVSISAPGNAPTGTAITTVGGLPNLHIPAKGSGGTISGLKLLVTDSTYGSGGSTAFTVPDFTIQAPIAADTFTRADGALGATEVGNLTWAVASGTTALVSGDKMVISAGSGFGSVDLDVGTANMDIRADVHSASSTPAINIAGGQAAIVMYNNQVSIYDSVAGTLTALVTYNHGGDATWRLVYKNGRITAYIAGSIVYDGSPTLPHAVGTQATFQSLPNDTTTYDNVSIWAS